MTALTTCSRNGDPTALAEVLNMLPAQCKETKGDAKEDALVVLKEIHSLLLDSVVMKIDLSLDQNTRPTS